MPRKLLHKGVCWKGNWPCRDDRCRPCVAYLTGAAMIEGEYALFPGAVAAQPTSSLREPSPGIRASLLMQAKFFRRERSCRSPRGDTQPLRLSAILVSTLAAKMSANGAAAAAGETPAARDVVSTQSASCRVFATTRLSRAAMRRATMRSRRSTASALLLRCRDAAPQAAEGSAENARSALIAASARSGAALLAAGVVDGHDKSEAMRPRAFSPNTKPPALSLSRLASATANAWRRLKSTPSAQTAWLATRRGIIFIHLALLRLG